MTVDDGGIPAITDDDRAGMQEFWKFYVPRRAALSAELRSRITGDHWETLYSGKTPTEVESDAAHVFSLQDRAIRCHEWIPYRDDLREQGSRYARAGVSFTAWFELITAYRGVLRDELGRFGTSNPPPALLEQIVRGMHRMLFFVIEAVGEGFISRRERVVIESALALEERLRQTQKLDALGRLAGGIAHDFNNALAVIAVYSTFLEEALDPSDARREDALEIQRATERAGVITRKLLTLSRQSIVTPIAIDLDARIAAFEPTLQRLVGPKVSLVIARSVVPIVLVDPEQIEQVVMNVVVNAAEAMPDGGRLSIELSVVDLGPATAAARAAPPGSYIVIAISDTGVGIDREAQRRIFEPFYTTKTSVHGAGLGLAIAHGIVTQAGGHITVYSEVGHGTSVRLHLPVAPGETDGGSIRVDREPSTAIDQVCVLVVDDQPELRAGIIRILQAAGCTTLEAATADAATQLCVNHEHPIDVVLIDVVLSDRRGDQMVAQLRELRPGIEVILMSGFPAGTLATTGVPVQLLAKPFTPAELRAAVARAARPGAVAAVVPAEVGRRPRILLVDDDQVMRGAVVRSLRAGDFEIVEVVDGASALVAVAANPFDVVVSDVMMPGMPGLELLRAIRRTDLDVPVIIMTGSPTVAAASEAIEHGAFRYLTKPFDPASLLKDVRHAIRAHALARLRREAFVIGGSRAAAVDRAGLESRFEQALDGLYMAYQPIVEARTGRAFGIEGLLRSTELSLPGPLEVLDAATTLGRLSQLGRKIRGLAAIPLAARDDTLAMFVNLHPDDLFDADLVDDTTPLARVAHRVVLEVTERASLMASPALTAKIAQLRKLGFRIAVDDIGSGFSGLTSFTELDPEFVKLDMAIVRDVHRSALKQRTIRALCRLCHEGGCVVVGEGVESIEERECLVELGCDLLQGYLIARPHRDIAV